MAPPSGATKARNAPVSRSARSVVPVIPLPYVRRANHAKQAAKDAQPTVNGSSLKIQHNAEPATPEPVIAEVEKKLEKVDIKEEASPVVTNGVSPVPHPAEPTPPPTESEATETTEETPESDLGQVNHAPEQPAQVQHEDVHPPANTSVVPPPAVPASRYTMPPPFQPSRAANPLTNGDLGRGPRHGINGPAHLHHPRPSSGSLQFGGFGSNSSSPVPPHSAGFGPPPGLSGPYDGRRQFQGHGHNLSGHGFPHIMPYGTEFVPVAGASTETLPFPGSNYGPGTPLSYQGSNSPNQPDDSGAFGNFRPPHGPNGIGGHPDEHRHHHHNSHNSHGFNGPPPGMLGGPMPPPPHVIRMMQEAQSTEPWAEYLQSQFQDKAFADCTLELRYLDDRESPIQLRGHRLILARSDPIRSILQSGHHEADPTIVLETSDKHLRSGAFWMAVQRLYGFPLLDGPDPHTMGETNMALAGGLDVRFDFALGYAAAGKLLAWPAVVIRGVEIAAHHMTWNTLEKALDFAMTDLPGRASADQHAPFAYGRPVEILMDAIISFVISQFPPFFQLDASVTDPAATSRIPRVPVSASSRDEQPSKTHSGKVQFGQGARARPTHIKFGDMGTPSPPHAGNGPEKYQLTAQEQAINTTLSRVLLNLPFAFLKPILEYVEPRFQSLRPVVAEREARRLRALEAVIEDRVFDAAEIRQSLQSVEPRHTGDAWHILGWQEDIVSYHGEGPSLGRQWVPLSGNTAHPDPEAMQPAYP
ncbi:hypothetical protein B0T11DRAFT_10104 [Plectosphaerella cucumerina]|uniref:BTB domain-containing protein n=1 Tax=Plectosphaerella cucumerina TaxID=40658 RepID=A0A8K0TS58_9PEZI|nr:hypothetical protein B0T11DRAFT_10104 [Plectosphaerella cucumerina]